MSIKITIVDDQDVEYKTIEDVLREFDQKEYEEFGGFEIVGKFNQLCNYSRSMAFIIAEKPDVILLDYDLNSELGTGIDLLIEIVHNMPNYLPAIIITSSNIKKLLNNTKYDWLHERLYVESIDKLKLTSRIFMVNEKSDFKRALQMASKVSGSRPLKSEGTIRLDGKTLIDSQIALFCTGVPRSKQIYCFYSEKMEIKYFILGHIDSLATTKQIISDHGLDGFYQVNSQVIINSNYNGYGLELIKGHRSNLTAFHFNNYKFMELRKKLDCTMYVSANTSSRK